MRAAPGVRRLLRPAARGHARTDGQALMRARCSAFAVGDPAYLLRSWHSSTRPTRLDLDDRQHWQRLEVLGTT